MLPMLAALAGTAISAGGSYLAGRNANKAAKAAAAAQAAASQRYDKDMAAALRDLEQWYGNAQGYLDPYVESGREANTLLSDIIGMNGAGAQTRAGEMYGTSPIATLIAKARDEVVRGTRGEAAASGMFRSGNLLKDLTERTADLDLRGYDNWQNLIGNQAATGYGASNASADLAYRHGGDRLGINQAKAAARAGGTIGVANTMMAGKNAQSQGMASALGTIGGFLGSPAFGSSLSGMFSGGGGAGSGTAFLSGMGSGGSYGFPYFGGPR